MSEKLCLQWNDFQENIKSAFGNLREDKDFKDVTLVCVDGSWKLTKWYYYSGDVDQLDEMVKSMMEKSQSKYADGHRKAHRCKVCGKEGKGNYIKYHIETNHIEGIVLPCNLCGKTFPSRKGLSSHFMEHFV